MSGAHNFRAKASGAASLVFGLSLLSGVEPPSAATPASATAQAERWTDAQGNFNRRARTGHVTNYDESKVGTYSLPDPLVLSSGLQVADRDVWENQRRPEILELYRSEIYGRVPSNAAMATFEVVETDPRALNGSAVQKRIVARFGSANQQGVTVNLVLYLPAGAKKPAPVLLQLLFGPPPSLAANGVGNLPSPSKEIGPISEILARGYAYALFRYTDVEPDGGKPGTTGIRSLAEKSDDAKPASDSWGSISAWAWGASRMLDYLQSDPAVDGHRVALIGHSRLGKTVLWAGAQDERFALVFSSCAGEMGSALSRRDYGETVDDMASNFGGQFAPNFGKYLGHWNDLPVDAHLLIALNAPRPVLISAGTQDQWADPRGEFLAEVAAGPVYRLLGRKDLGTTEFPSVDVPITNGDLAFFYHTGPHAITSADWKVFLDFADRYLRH